MINSKVPNKPVKAALVLELEYEDGARQRIECDQLEARPNLYYPSKNKVHQGFREQTKIQVEFMESEPEYELGYAHDFNRIHPPTDSFIRVNIVAQMKPKDKSGSNVTMRMMNLDVIKKTAEDEQTLRLTLMAEQELLWNDLNNQLHQADNAHWSIGVEHVVLRLVSLARASEVIDWQKVPQRLVASGIYSAIVHRVTGTNPDLPEHAWRGGYFWKLRLVPSKIAEMKLDLEDYDDTED